MRFTTSHHGLYCKHFRQFHNCTGWGTCELILDAHTVSHLCQCDKWEEIELEDKNVAIKKDGNFDNLKMENEK